MSADAVDVLIAFIRGMAVGFAIGLTVVGALVLMGGAK